MGKKIRIQSGTVEVTAELNDTKTALAIWEALPIKGRVSLWGDEIYFSIPVSLEPDNGQEVVSMGDVGYWPPGNGFCIFFGPTPMSRGQEIRPASPVNVFGKIIGDTEVLRQVASGTDIVIEKEAQD
ncbi:cyclophilin-like fold protein [Chloroflexota bacterium]